MVEIAIMKFFRVAVPQVLEYSCPDQTVGDSMPCSLCAKVLLDNILNPSLVPDSAPPVCERIVSRWQPAG